MEQDPTNGKSVRSEDLTQTQEVEPLRDTVTDLEDVPTVTISAEQLESLVVMRDRLIEEKGRLEQEKAEINDLLLRRAAEFDNYRKRTDREKAEIAEYGAMDAVRAMLAVLDDFERALAVETADAEYARGMGLICQRLSDALKKLGVEQLESVGQPFDPNFHHAIEVVETSDAEDNTVIDELAKGYLFKGRLLRPAMVRVSARKQTE